MSTHESAVNYANLIRDLADMYTQDVAEVVLVELIANSLDAGATQIKIDFDQNNRILIIEDNGCGMSSENFEQYHDFAAGLKTRGDGIGFAGVGAKISFNIADKVITETRSKSFSGGSDWHFRSKTKLVWEDVKPTNIRSHGTRVEVRFGEKAKLPYFTTADLINILRRNYLPLTDLKFLELYDNLKYYSRKLRFIVNGEKVEPCDLVKTFGLTKTKMFFPQKRGKKIGYGVFGLTSTEYPLGPCIAGVLLCTRGKVIKSELFSQFPGEIGPRIFGVVEVPDFVSYLTTSKTDFMRRGRHRELESLYSPIRQEFTSWLAELGVQQAGQDDTDESLKLERELQKIIDDVPELSEFFGFRIRREILTEDDKGDINANIHDGSQITFAGGEGSKGNNSTCIDAGEENGTALENDKAGSLRAKPISRSTKHGPRITFLKAPQRVEVGWVEGNAVVINSGHPCFMKVGTNSLGKRLHNFYAVATIVQRFIGNTETKPDLMFIDRMMAAWGQK